MSVRTRFAPSPTGYLHVGGIRTALFAWLVARQARGQFILRLEDTDKKREIKGAAKHIVESLDVLGLSPDEGPYRQSERLATYRQWAQKLIDLGRAYADPYSPQEVQSFREAANKAKKPFLYRNHRPQRPPKWDGHMPLRFKSDPKDYQWHDAVMGDLSTGPEVIDDFILIKSDGFPTYNFAHIIDDAEMQISHVIRGQEFLASMPNYLNLYEALGIHERPKNPHEDGVQGTAEQRSEPYTRYGERAEKTATQHSASSTDSVSSSAGKQDSAMRYFRPVMATMPHILGPDGKKKLSKRDGAKDVLDYLRMGYLPEALLSFIATLGWNDGTEQEVFTREELIKKFSLDRVQKSGARFDEKRLNWVNGYFIREMPIDELYRKVETAWPKEARQYNAAYKKRVLSLVQERLKFLSELSNLTDFFFKDLPVNLKLLSSHKELSKMGKAELCALLTRVQDTLKDSDFSFDNLTKILNELLAQTNQKPAVLFSLIRIATTQAPASPGLAETLAVLGRERSLARLRSTLDALAA